MALADEIAAGVAAYSRGEPTLAELRKGRAALTWSAEARGGEDEQRPAGNVELALVEFEAGHMAETKLRSELREQFSSIWIRQAEIRRGASVDLAPDSGPSSWEKRSISTESSWQVVQTA